MCKYTESFLNIINVIKKFNVRVNSVLVSTNLFDIDGVFGVAING